GGAAPARTNEGRPSRLEEDRRLDHDRSGEAIPTDPFDPRCELGGDQRMHDRVQARAGGGIGEHDRAERAPIDRPVGGDDRGPERVDDRRGAGASGPVDLVTDPVGVDHARAELGEDRGDRALARADAAREPDCHYRAPHTWRLKTPPPTPGGFKTPPPTPGGSPSSCPSG